MKRLFFFIFIIFILTPAFSINYESFGEKNYVKYVLTHDDNIVHAYSSKSDPELMAKFFSLLNDEEYNSYPVGNETFLKFEDTAFLNKSTYCETINRSLIYSLIYDNFESFFELEFNYNTIDKKLCEGVFLTGEKVSIYDVILSEIDYGDYMFYEVMPQFGSSFFDIKEELKLIKEFNSNLNVSIAEYYDEDYYYYFSKNSHNLLVIVSEIILEKNDSSFEYFSNDISDGYGFSSLTKTTTSNELGYLVGSIAIFLVFKFIKKIIKK